MDKPLIINIGRQFGSGGRSVAEVLGQKLGIKVYDNDLITEAAKKSGFSPALLQHSDEKRKLFSLSSFFSQGGISVTEDYISDNEMFKIQSETIKDIASKGSAIFIGRCSDYILREMDCVDVFICAPMKDRKERISQRLGLSLEDAENLCNKKDRVRETYYNFFTFGNWGVASNYDICIDSSILGIEGTADLIINFIKQQGK
ncbi:MAG: cytidylate kinase-like family protein [Bacteroidales bacterium]|nr:cytidylate kinase-like family protein [Bacteroidales bacterium]